MSLKISLTGDRPTGPLHLGHYVGSLQNRLNLEKTHDSFVMIADVQALTDHFQNPISIQINILEVLSDYLAIGLDPTQTTFFLQSWIPELMELTIYLMNLVTVARLERNPTVKLEIRQKNMEHSLPVGFFCYPISQAADIIAFDTDIVPVGEDQLPMIEITNDIVRRFHHIYGTGVLKECKALVGEYPRLIGLDGQSKASKSLNNAIFLKDDPATLKEKVLSMYTDPHHIKISDPGRVEGNVVFSYLDVFYSDKAHLNELKEHYKKGGLGDMAIKKILLESLSNFLDPIRDRRMSIKKNDAMDILNMGSDKAREIAKKNLNLVKEKMGFNF
jgi:tryptophanyl-tRNA synthetase